MSYEEYIDQKDDSVNLSSLQNKMSSVTKRSSTLNGIHKYRDMKHCGVLIRSCICLGVSGRKSRLRLMQF